MITHLLVNYANRNNFVSIAASTTTFTGDVAARCNSTPQRKGKLKLLWFCVVRTWFNIKTHWPRDRHDLCILALRF